MRQEALDWFSEGETDLQRARRSLEAEDYAWSCFESHQATEKGMKALIIGLEHRVPPRTHDLTELLQEVVDLGLVVAEADLSDLSQYYVTSRYPSAGPHRPSRSFTRPPAERALHIAEETLADARRLLARTFLYGSFARGDWLDDSDIDMVVVCKDFTEDLEKRMAKLRRLAPYTMSFQILAYTPREIERKLEQSLIWRDIASHWVELTPKENIGDEKNG